MSGIAVLRAILIANAPLTAEIPADRIVADDLPANVALPALSIHLISSEPRRTLAKELKVRVRDRVQVTIHARDAVQRLKLVGLVKRAAAFVGGDIDDVTDVSVLSDGQGPDFTGDTGIRMRTQDFMVSYNEAA